MVPTVRCFWFGVAAANDFTFIETDSCVRSGKPMQNSP